MICIADFFSKKNDTFSAKMQYVQKYLSHGGLTLWLLLMKISFACSWAKWRHQPLSWWGLTSGRTAAYYYGYVQSMLLVREGPSSGATGWMVVTEYCDYGSHQYNRFFFLLFPKFEFTYCFHKHADLCMSCSTSCSCTLTLSPLCSFGHHSIKKMWSY